MKYQAHYSDLLGTELALLSNDNHLITLHIRGVTFHGSSFDGLEIAGLIDTNLKKQFVFNSLNELRNFHLRFSIPILVVHELIETACNLDIELISSYDQNSDLDLSEQIHLELHWQDQKFKTQKTSGSQDFEDALLKLNMLLPDNTYIKCCFNCLYSDYHPAGKTSFGDMMCFFSERDLYLKSSDKEHIMDIWERGEQSVQEIYVCQNFKRRLPNTGYRG